MLAVYLSPLYLAVNLYLLHRIFTWLTDIHPFFEKRAVRIVLGICYFFVAFSPGIGFLVPAGTAQRILKGLGYYWMGIMLYTALIVIAACTCRNDLLFSDCRDQHLWNVQCTFHPDHSV